MIDDDTIKKGDKSVLLSANRVEIAMKSTADKENEREREKERKQL